MATEDAAVPKIAVIEGKTVIGQFTKFNNDTGATENESIQVGDILETNMPFFPLDDKCLIW